jgi:[ribosomal protein S5]-alanine N-acetyltransferase
MTDPLPRTAGNVVLRRLATTDLRAFQAYRHDPELGRYQGWAATPDHDARDFLSYMNKAELLRPGVSCQIGIADAASLELIGDIALILARDARQAEIGFTLRKQSQGRGLASAAVKEAIALVFETTSAQRLVGIADARNVSSVRLLERLGMRREQTRAARSRGQPCVELVYVANKRHDG